MFKEIFILATRNFILPAFVLSELAELFDQQNNYSLNIARPKYNPYKINNIEYDPLVAAT